MTEEQRSPGRYPVEMRDRAVRMVFEAERHGRSQREGDLFGGGEAGSDAGDGAQMGASG